MFGGKQASDGGLFSGSVGKYVIVRSRNEGINCGTVVAANEHGVVLANARRIWWHKPKDTNMSWYEGVSKSGVSDDSKLSESVSQKVIIEDYSLTDCTPEARASLEGAKSHVG